MSFVMRNIHRLREMLTAFPLDARIPLRRLGSDYGGWVFPENAITAESVCYLAGAGTDISFDLELAHHYGCQVHIFDPTPRAKAHYDDVRSAILTARTHDLPARPRYPDDPDAVRRTQFHAYGIWHRNETLKFYAPANPDHVSHSVKNLQKTGEYFLAEVKDLLTVMNTLGHDRIHLLKLDIEGAEYEVLDDIITRQIPVDIICVEFDENHRKHLDAHYLRRIKNTIARMRDNHFLLVHREKPFDLTFVHRSRQDLLPPD